MSQKLPVGGFKWKKSIYKFDDDFIGNYDEDSEKGYILEVDVEFSKNLLNIHSDLPLLAKRKKTKKMKKFVCNINDKKKLRCSLESSKTSIKSWTNIKKVHRVIQINQKAWLKPYIDKNSKLRTEAKKKKRFEKDFLKLMNNSVFGKTMENVRKYRDFKLVTTNKRRNELVS